MSVDETPEPTKASSRGAFLRTAAVASAGVAGLGALPAIAQAGGPWRDPWHRRPPAPSSGLTEGDIAILAAASIAEALAVTTYTSIINTAPFYANLPEPDQQYLLAARQEEMSHYALEISVTKKPSPFGTFYYPPNMFADAQTTLNTLVTLEDAFIAAYLVGVRYFSTADLRVTAARIMGIESDHRTLARVIGGDIASSDGGPLTTITGFQGVAEPVEPANNNAYERTLGLTNIDQAVSALLPFADDVSAKAAGFDVTKPYTFAPFTPTVPIDLGDFHGFAG